MGRIGKEEKSEVSGISQTSNYYENKSINKQDSNPVKTGAALGGCISTGLIGGTAAASLYESAKKSKIKITNADTVNFGVLKDIAKKRLSEKPSVLEALGDVIKKNPKTCIGIAALWIATASLVGAGIGKLVEVVNNKNSESQSNLDVEV